MPTSHLSICFTIAVALATVFGTDAQRTSAAERSARRSERAARDNWQPTRLDVDEAEAKSIELERGDWQPPYIRRVEAVAPAPIQDEAGPLPEALCGVPVTAPSAPQPARRLGLFYDWKQRLWGNQNKPCPADCDGNCGNGCAPAGCDSMGTDSCACGSVECGGQCKPKVLSCGSCEGQGCSLCGEFTSPEAWKPYVTIRLPQDGWVNVEYLSWEQDGLPLPPLITTSTDPAIPRPQAGVLGDPTTQILFGGEEVLTEEFEGARTRFGIWLDNGHTWGFGVELFEIGTEVVSFGTESTGDPILARPFFNTQTGLEDSGLIAFPAVATGSVAAAAATRFRGLGLTFRRLRRCKEGCSPFLFFGPNSDFCSRVEAIFGLRLLELQESVQIREDMVSADVTSPGSLSIFDQFDTRNRFDGFELGWSYRHVRGFWSFESLLRLGIGNNRQTITIRGGTRVEDPTNTPVVQSLPGGFLAQESNIGTFQQNEFSVVPELNLNLGFQVTDRFRVTLGYTGIYWSNVVRPSDHMSRDINPAFFPPASVPFTGVRRPEFAFQTRDYWVQGFNIGGEYRW